MHKKLFILGLLVSLITSIVSACGGTPAAEPAIAPAEEANEEPAAGLANPASVYCQEQGGTVEIRTDAEGGQYGVCIFDDGSECEEWAFFRGECEPATEEAAPAEVPATPTDEPVSATDASAADPLRDRDPDAGPITEDEARGLDENEARDHPGGKEAFMDMWGDAPSLEI